MTEELRALRERYVKAKTQKDKEAINIEIHKLMNSDPEAFAEAMIQLIRETTKKVEALNIREQLQEVLPAVSLAYIAKTYFGKSRQWLYQRVNNSPVNGKPAYFTPDELKTLENALHDIGKKLTFINVSR